MIVTGSTLPLPDSRAAVLRAVLIQDRPTIRSVAFEAGVSVGEAYRHLLILRHQGFVSWAVGPNGRSCPGTLAANVTAHRPLEALARDAARDDDGPTTTTPQEEP